MAAMIAFLIILLLVPAQHVTSFADLSRPRSLCRIPNVSPLASANSAGIFQLQMQCDDGIVFDKKALHKKLDKDFAAVSFPAFVSLAADPIAAIVDAMYVARLGAVAQAAMGIAISAQFSVSKLYNDPLLKTSTSLVAGKEGEGLEASVASAIATAVAIGFIQCIVFLTLGKRILQIMGVGRQSEMLKPAISYLKWRSLGVPAATVTLVANGIFRGRGDTKTPLYCTLFGSALNIILDPLLIFTLGMGCSGAGAAAAISQWCTVVPILYMLNRSVPIRIIGRSRAFFQGAVQAYWEAGGLLLLRTLAKIGTYSITTSAAARLGTVPMAAYSITFNLGFATSQLCEAIAIASQALIARDFPFNNPRRVAAARHIIQRSVSLGLLISGTLSLLTYLNQRTILNVLTKSPEVFAAATAVMPIVLVTQLFKGLAYSTGGILLGGLDWKWSSLGAMISGFICVVLTVLMPPSLWNIWAALSVLMGTQVLLAGLRFTSGRGAWKGLNLLSFENEGSSKRDENKKSNV